MSVAEEVVTFETRTKIECFYANERLVSVEKDGKLDFPWGAKLNGEGKKAALTLFLVSLLPLDHDESYHAMCDRLESLALIGQPIPEKEGD